MTNKRFIPLTNFKNAGFFVTSNNKNIKDYVDNNRHEAYAKTYDLLNDNKEFFSKLCYNLESYMNILCYINALANNNNPTYIINAMDLYIFVLQLGYMLDDSKNNIEFKTHINIKDLLLVYNVILVTYKHIIKKG